MWTIVWRQTGSKIKESKPLTCKPASIAALLRCIATGLYIICSDLQPQLVTMERTTKYKKRIPVEQKEPPSDYEHYTGAAGLLRYRREPGHTVNLATLRPGHRSWAEYPADCEYCGQTAKPLLELSWQRWHEKALAFCCIQRQQLYELLEVDRCMAGGRYFTSREAVIEEPNQFDMEWTCGFEEESKEIVLEDALLQQPVTAENSTHALSFRLSRAPERCWTVYPRGMVEQHFTRKEKEEQITGWSAHKQLKFGICDYQVGSEFAQKNYSSGTRLLTAFSDGSAQLFYPSGSLAIAVMDTEDTGGVCIVYDDSSTPSEATRAIFHSDGRAKCYHSNRNIWLSLNKSVGRCLEQDGSRLRQWSWSGFGRVPTVLDPIHLNLNKWIKLQILGREQVFICFQACGEDVKFSVGSLPDAAFQHKPTRGC